MKVLVTGGLGFIGSSLSESLLEKNHDVRSIDNLDSFYDPSLKLLNLDYLKKNPRFTNKIFDINDGKALVQELEEFRPDVVVHAAGRAGVRPSLKDPLGYIHSNLNGLTVLLESMREAGIKNLAFSSSSSVYGKRETSQFTEDMPFDSAISFYAATKQCGEIINQQYHNLYDLSIINMRFFTVYGPRQRPDLAIHKFLKAAVLDEPITLFGDGTMRRDYTYIDDIVFGIEQIIDRLQSSEKSLFETYNLGNSSPVDLIELVETIEKVTNKKLKVNHVDVPAGDVPITYADISKAKEVLGYSPKVPLEEGLANFYEWMISNEIYKES